MSSLTNLRHETLDAAQESDRHHFGGHAEFRGNLGHLLLADPNACYDLPLEGGKLLQNLEELVQAFPSLIDGAGGRIGSLDVVHLPMNRA